MIFSDSMRSNHSQLKALRWLFPDLPLKALHDLFCLHSISLLPFLTTFTLCLPRHLQFILQFNLSSGPFPSILFWNVLPVDHCKDDSADTSSETPSLATQSRAPHAHYPVLRRISHHLEWLYLLFRCFLPVFLSRTSGPQQQATHTLCPSTLSIIF